MLVKSCCSCKILTNTLVLWSEENERIDSPFHLVNEFAWRTWLSTVLRLAHVPIFLVFELPFFAGVPGLDFPCVDLFVAFTSLKKLGNTGNTVERDEPQSAVFKSQPRHLEYRSDWSTFCQKFSGSVKIV